MKYTWSATQQFNNFYDTLFAVEVLDTNIVKVIISNEINNENYLSMISNEINNQNYLSLSEAKKQSSVFFELDVINGYTAHYSYLHTSDVGEFVFRGLNSEGKVIWIQ
jgi:hypothetical protein